MLKHKIYLLLKTIFIIATFFLIASCDSLGIGSKTENLLAIHVDSSEVMDVNEFNHLLKALPKNAQQRDLFYFLSDFSFIPSSLNSVISVRKDNKRSAYNAVIIYDDVPDDDSVSGYRFDIEFYEAEENEEWKLVEVRRSWRCWEGRGHREFSTVPCS